MIPQLVQIFENSVKFIEDSVTDLSEEQMVEQPAGVPNHATWTLGHIIFSCQGIAAELGADAWLPESWESTFGYGSTPSSELSCYPKKSEMLARLADSASRLRRALLGASESVLKQPLPDEALPTMEHVLLQVVAAHTAYHVGQLTVWRRAIGMKSTGVFI
jgi:uncharacterized damage-inducible protein DinB